jgi:hypothetical protein
MSRGPASVSSQGLLAFWADIDPGYVLRFQQWHNCEHIPERLSIPGFLAGRRYRGLEAARTFFMFYETDGPEVLGSTAYVAALNRPTPWTQESLQHFRRPLRTAYRKLAEDGEAARTEAPYLAAYRFDLVDGGSSSRAAAHAAAWLTVVSAVPSVQRARLYQRDAGTSSIVTQERQIYRGVQGEQSHLALFECSAPDPWNAAEWQSHERALAAETRPEALFRTIERESYWLEIALYASER